MLANNSITNLYKIEVSHWESISLRVEKVFDLKNLEKIVAKTIPGYPALLKSTYLWSEDTFDNLVGQSKAISNYASLAILKFTELQNEVHKIEGDVVPQYVQDLTIDLLKEFSNNTLSLSKKIEKTSLEISEFMEYNHVVDAEMAIHSESLGVFWEPIGKVIKAVDIATSKVTGAWRALKDDWNITNDKNITITMPFIMSLDIKASIILWEQIIQDTLVFSDSIKEIAEKEVGN